MACTHLHRPAAALEAFSAFLGWKRSSGRKRVTISLTNLGLMLSLSYCLSELMKFASASIFCDGPQ